MMHQPMFVMLDAKFTLLTKSQTMGRYPRSVRFDDSLKFYKAPLEEGENADA